MGYYRSIFGYVAFLVFSFGLLFYPYLKRPVVEEPSGPRLDILAYSSFIKAWGPGPALARRFTQLYGIPIRWIDGGNAGLILERLRFKNTLDRSDVVLGFDQFLLMEARKTMGWRDVSDVYRSVEQSLLPEGSVARDFFAFDWGALSFVYREGEINPPKKLSDLLTSPYKRKLILQDPRMSSPGLQFLFWSLQVFGEKEGLDFLKKIKTSIEILAPSWSSAYSLFQVKPGTMVFSYFTSPYYHKKEEGRNDYRAVSFEHPHPIQVEYAGIPGTCEDCDAAELFLKFLASAEAQKILLEKNYMYPMNGQALVDSDVHLPENIKYYSPVESWRFIRDRKKWVDKWKKLFY